MSGKTEVDSYQAAREAYLEISKARRHGDYYYGSPWHHADAVVKGMHQVVRGTLEHVQGDRNIILLPSPWHAAIYLADFELRQRLQRRRPLFRGQRRSCWDVRPSILHDGISRDREFSKNKRLKHILNEIARNEFLLDGVSHPHTVKIEFDEYQCRAVAQHYGIKTNLIDFTTDPNVAIWFAALNATPADSETASVFALDLWEVLEQGFRIAIPPPYVVRIHNQKGVFLESDAPVKLGNELGYGFEIRFPTRAAFGENNRFSIGPDDLLYDCIGLSSAVEELSKMEGVLDATTSASIVAKIDQNIERYFGAPDNMWMQFALKFRDFISELAFFSHHKCAYWEKEIFKPIILQNRELAKEMVKVWEWLHRFWRGTAQESEEFINLVQKILEPGDFDGSEPGLQPRLRADGRSTLSQSELLASVRAAQHAYSLLCEKPSRTFGIYDSDKATDTVVTDALRGTLDKEDVFCHGMKFLPSDGNTIELPSPWHAAICAEDWSRAKRREGIPLLFCGQSNWNRVISPSLLEEGVNREVEIRKQRALAQILRSIIVNKDAFVLFDEEIDMESRHDLTFCFDELQCRAVAQHFGIKTNLIKFTTSPDIAVHFACLESFLRGCETSSVFLIGVDELLRRELRLVIAPPLFESMHIQHCVFVEAIQPLRFDGNVLQITFPARFRVDAATYETFALQCENASAIWYDSIGLSSAIDRIAAACANASSAPRPEDEIAEELNRRIGAEYPRRMFMWLEFARRFSDGIGRLSMVPYYSNRSLAYDPYILTKLVRENSSVATAMLAVFRMMSFMAGKAGPRAMLDSLPGLEIGIRKILRMPISELNLEPPLWPEEGSTRSFVDEDYRLGRQLGPISIQPRLKVNLERPPKDSVVRYRRVTDLPD